MQALEDGTIDRIAALRDRLEAGLLQTSGTGVNGANSINIAQMPGAPSLPRLCFCGKGGIAQTSTGQDHDNECDPGAPGLASETWEPSNPVPRVANTTNIWFDHLEGEALVIALDLKGVAVSGGSACHSGATEPSHVLMAMGLDKTRARASLRFSLLKTATDADVDRVLQVVPEAVEHLRAISPVAAGTAG
jgi:cysteine desulfurase